MTRLAERDQAGVIASAAAGDEIAFKQLVVVHHHDMRRVCRYVTRDDANTDEAVQALLAMRYVAGFNATELSGVLGGCSR